MLVEWILLLLLLLLVSEHILLHYYNEHFDFCVLLNFYFRVVLNTLVVKYVQYSRGK